MSGRHSRLASLWPLACSAFPCSPLLSCSRRQLRLDARVRRSSRLSKLRVALDAALSESSLAREDAARAEQEATAELTRTVWPTQLSGLCARAIVLHVLKAATAVRGAGADLLLERSTSRLPACPEQPSSCRLLPIHAL